MNQETIKTPEGSILRYTYNVSMSNKTCYECNKFNKIRSIVTVEIDEKNQG